MSETLPQESAPTISKVLEELEDVATIVPGAELEVEETSENTDNSEVVRVPLISQGIIEGLKHTDDGIRMYYTNSTTEIEGVAKSSLQLRKDVIEQNTTTKALVEESYNERLHAIERRRAQVIAMVEQHFALEKQAASVERFTRDERLNQIESIHQSFFDSKKAAVNIIADQISQGKNFLERIEAQRSAAIETYNQLATKKNELLQKRAKTEKEKAQAETDRFLIDRSTKQPITEKAQVEFDIEIEEESLTLSEMEPIYVEHGIEVDGEHLPKDLPLGLQESTDSVKATVNSDNLKLLKAKNAEYERLLNEKLKLIDGLDEEIAAYVLQLEEIDNELQNTDVKMSEVAFKLDKLVERTNQLQDHSKRTRKFSLQLTASQNDASEDDGEEYADFIESVRANQRSWSEVMAANIMDIVTEVPAELQAKPIYAEEVFGALLDLEVTEEDEKTLDKMIEDGGKMAETQEKGAELLDTMQSPFKIVGSVIKVAQTGIVRRGKKLIVRKEDANASK